MMKNMTSTMAALAVAAIFSLSNQASAQNCSSCASGDGFGFPVASQSGTSCSGGGCRLRGSLGHGGGHFQEFKNKMDHYAVLNAKIAARNDAWPKPFACLDKRDYYGIWSTMLDAGTETQCVLDGDFFGEANDLNRIGIDRVRGIMTNMPSADRTVFVHRTNNEAVDNARIAAIRNTIDTYYGHLGAADIKLSDNLPRSISGLQVQQYSTLRAENLAAPIIQVGDGDSVANSVQN